MAILTQNIAHSTFFTPQAYRVVLYTEPQIKRFVRFVRLLPFGQWVFDKSRVQKKIGVPFSCKIRLKSLLSCQGTIKIKENQNLNQKEKIKKRIVFAQRNAFLLVFKALHTSYFAKMHKINVSTLLECIKLAFLFC